MIGGCGTGVGEGSKFSDSLVDSASSCAGSMTSGCDVCGISRFGSGSTSSASASGSTSGSASALFALVVRMVLAFLEFVRLTRPPAAFRFAFVAVDAADIFDMTEMVLVSIDSSRSGMSVMLSPSDCIDMLDCVERRVEAFDVREAFEALPFLAFGRFEGAVVPAK